MIDNFQQIRKLLKFRTEDDFYFVQILQRKKDHKDGKTKVNGTNNNARLIKAYCVKSLEHFDWLKPEIVGLCKVFNARAGINLNRRSFKKISLHHLKKVTDQILNGSFNKAHKAYSSVVGIHNNENDKRWILDIDNWDVNDKDNRETLDKLIIHLDGLQPVGDKFITIIPSKSGIHLITRPFNLKDFKENCPSIEVHKNNPTNLYIP